MHRHIRAQDAGTPRETPDDIKAQRLPQSYRALIRADDKVELHRAIPARSGIRQRMFAHASRNAAPGGRPTSHVPDTKTCFDPANVRSGPYRPREAAIASVQLHRRLRKSSLIIDEYVVEAGGSQ